MPKPSIFSKDYDEKMKKRKRNRRITVIIILIVSVIVIFITSLSSKLGLEAKLGINKIKGIVITRMNNDSKEKTNGDSNTNNNDSKIKKEETVDKSNEKNPDATVQEEVVKKEETGEYTVKLSNGEEIKLKYSIINNEKNYLEVMPKTIIYDISPSKKMIVVLENITQNLILFDINGTLKDITKKQYTSSKGTIFDKDSVIKAGSGFIWSASPKFVNEDNIIYQSQLPWFNKDNIKYIWEYTISSNVYEHNLKGGIGEVFGTDIKYGNLSSEGLEVIVDGNTKIIK